MNVQTIRAVCTVFSQVYKGEFCLVYKIFNDKCKGMCYNIHSRFLKKREVLTVGKKSKTNMKDHRRSLQDNPDVLMLLKSHHKGLLRIVFSRFGLIALLLVIQVIGLNLLFVAMEESEWLLLLMGVFIIIMFFYLFKIDMDATAKLTWLVMMMLFPLMTSILLLVTRHKIGYRSMERKLEDLNEQSKDMIRQDEKVLNAPEIVSSGTKAMCHYLNKTGTFPVYANTEVTYFPLGENKYEAMLEELKKAEHFIFMEYFIIDEGLMWGSILKILADKAAQGVDVRVMYDGMCEMSTLSGDYPERLAEYGIKSKAFSKLQPFISTHYNYRDHRKILVIDGKVAFNGGVNLADEYINEIVRFGHWKDTALMLKGEAVESFTRMFLQMWNLTEENVEWGNFMDKKYPVKSKGYVMPYSDSPMDGYKVGESVYVDILYSAKKYVHIMTPYLILDNELEAALKYAAQRGVDVKLILPGIPDKKSAFSLAKSHYKALISTGVEIYEYTPGFVHAKVFVSDDHKAVVGTINLDYRSLYHHFECATYLYDTECIPSIEEDFQQTLAKCSKVTFETIKNEKLSYKIRGSIMKLIAPLL